MPAKKLVKRPAKTARTKPVQPVVKVPQTLPGPNVAPAVATSPFLLGAERIGTLLCRDAIWSSGRCNWLTWAMDPMAGYSLHYRSSGRSLYDGTAGIALFLAELHRFTAEPEVKAVVDGAGALLLEHAAKISEQEDHSLYAGMMGIALVLLRLGEILNREDFQTQGLKLAEKAGSSPTQPLMTDVLCGNAGLLLPLISLGQRFKKTKLIELAQDHARRLTASAVRNPHGVSWAGPDPGMSNLLGYSHGNAGIALSLLELDNVAPDKNLRELADQALAYERSHFNATLGNWPDLRNHPQIPSGQASYPVAWCHGATGIGLARSRLLELRPGDAIVTGELMAAVNTAARYLAAPRDPSSSDFSYCHGLAASAELLLDAGLQLKRPDLVETARLTGSYGLEQHLNSGWPCGVIGAPEVPGFMLGTAGIGYFMLRLHAPGQVESMLVMRPTTR